MAFFKPKNTLDKLFETSLLLKGLDGLAEILGGLALLIINPEHISNWTKSLTASQLAEDPHDFIANHLVNWANGFTKASAVFAAIYLLSHGVIKVVLVIEVLRNHLWAYIALIVVTIGFIIYQLYHIIHKPTVSFVLLTILDVIIVYLTTREYGKQKELRAKTE